jgi:hypothetical protein
MNSDENSIVPLTAAVVPDNGDGTSAATGTAPSPRVPIRALKHTSGDPLVAFRRRAGRRP